MSWLLQLMINTHRKHQMLNINTKNIKAYVEIQHIPTGITVSCNAYRSQHQNRDACFRRLRSLLYAKQQQLVENDLVVRSVVFYD